MTTTTQKQPLPKITDSKHLEIMKFFIDAGWTIDVQYFGKVLAIYQMSHARSVIFLTVRPDRFEMRTCYNYDIFMGSRIRTELKFKRNAEVRDQRIYTYAR